MALSLRRGALIPQREERMLLGRWIIALLVPVALFTFVWGESIMNNVLLSVFGFIPARQQLYDTPTLLFSTLFMIVFYGTVIALTGYLAAADSGRRSNIAIWLDVLFFIVIPLLLVQATGLIIGLALCALVWPLYFYGRKQVQQARHIVPPAPLESIEPLNEEQRQKLMHRATIAGLWFGAAFAALFLVVDLVYFFTGSLPGILLIWVVVRTLLFPVAGYFLGRVGGTVALRRTLTPQGTVVGEDVDTGVDKLHELEVLSKARAQEEVQDLVPNDLPLRSGGARRFYLILLVGFVLLYPFIDPFLFSYGTEGRLAGFGNAGYYVILALGLNIVVGFAGLLDLGYVAFFAIGAYTWGMVGSQQFSVITGIAVNPQVWPWLFWPMIIVTALIAALWGVMLGAPTLRLRGDYLAIVTLGFGEIVPVVFLNLDKYTNGTNGIVGVFSPAFPGVNWSITTSTPYYYLILALIALVIFANVRLRDSRLGRAWVAIREDEIAASSSGINLVRTKLFAFGAGAFFSGIAGAYYSAKLGGVSPDNFSFNDSVIYLAMVVIGGLGSIPGVIVGALAVYAINQFILAQLDTIAADPNSFMHPVSLAITHYIPGFTFGNIRNLVFGIILVAVMIFRPEGLIPSARRKRELKAGNVEEVQVGALDVPPGTPGFESEVHVE